MSAGVAIARIFSTLALIALPELGAVSYTHLGKPFAIVLEIDFYKDLLLYLDDIIDTKKALERFSIYKESGEKEITLDQLKLQMLKEGFSEGELIANNAQ